MSRIRENISGYFSSEINRYRFFSLVIFILIITALAWQSDDSYHAYVMAKHLVEGNGFVYNIGERASATSCPLFTLIVALGYFVFRNMFLVSLLINIIFSAAAYYIFVKDFCMSKKQIVYSFAAMIGCTSFISYTTSGLENSLLFLLSAIFLKKYFENEKYDAGRLFVLGLLISLIAMTRMDAVLMFVPMVLYAYIAKRERVSFIRSVGIGALGLMPFAAWEIFSLIYYGFLVPNTAFVKLGTDIPRIEYIKRGVWYYLNSALCDIPVLLIPFAVILITFFVKKARYLWMSAGIALYGIYILYIGGDFMMGRHFTVMFFISLIGFNEMYNREFADNVRRNKGNIVFMKTVIIAGLIYVMTMGVITDQFLFGQKFSSPVSDERANYFKWTSLFNNAVSYLTTGEMCIRDAWNDEGIDRLREMGYSGGILKMVPGISIYYNSDMYLNDMYGLGDPFLSKLPAVREAGWRIGHMWREAPEGYDVTVISGENQIVNEDISRYYEVIKLITRGRIFDKERLKAVIDINLGKYDHLIDAYKSTLDENNRQIITE